MNLFRPPKIRAPSLTPRLGGIRHQLSLSGREAGNLASRELRPMGRKDYSLKLY